MGVNKLPNFFSGDDIRLLDAFFQQLRQAQEEEIPIIDRRITLNDLETIPGPIVRIGDADPHVVRALTENNTRITAIVIEQEATQLAVAAISGIIQVVVKRGADPAVVAVLNDTPVVSVMIGEDVTPDVVRAIPQGCIIQTLGNISLESLQALQGQYFGLNKWSTVEIVEGLSGNIRSVYVFGGTRVPVIEALVNKTNIYEVIIDRYTSFEQARAIPECFVVCINDALPAVVHGIRSRMVVINDHTTPQAVGELPQGVSVRLGSATLDAVRALKNSEVDNVVVDSNVTKEQSRAIPESCSVVIEDASKEVVSQLQSQFALVGLGAMPGSVRALRRTPVGKVGIYPDSDSDAVRAIPAGKEVFSYSEENPENIQVALNVRKARMELLTRISMCLTYLTQEVGRDFLDLIDDEKYAEAIGIALEKNWSELVRMIFQYKDRLEIRGNRTVLNSKITEGDTGVYGSDHSVGFWSGAHSQKSDAKNKRRHEKDDQDAQRCKHPR